MDARSHLSAVWCLFSTTTKFSGTSSHGTLAVRSCPVVPLNFDGRRFGLHSNISRGVWICLNIQTHPYEWRCSTRLFLLLLASCFYYSNKQKYIALRTKSQPDSLSFLIYFNKYPLHVSNTLTIYRASTLTGCKHDQGWTVLATNHRGCTINTTDCTYSKLPAVDE